MSNSEFSELRSRKAVILSLRVILIVAGGLLIVFALFADRAGLGQSGGFGSGQFLMIVFGSLFLISGFLWGRFPNFYRNLAVIILNTLILIALIELASIAIARLNLIPTYRSEVFATYHELPYYAGQEWSSTYWKEATQAENYGYSPYDVWSHLPYSGETINVGIDGIRLTPRAVCTEDALHVFAFGGSTMWGWGAPDWETIASHLQAGLDLVQDGPVCVTNFGEDGYVSTQEVISLLKQLQIGNVPDIVIFYDGINDVFAAYESGNPGEHPLLSELGALFEEQEHPLIAWVKSSRVYALTERLVARMAFNPAADSSLPENGPVDAEAEELGSATAEVYLNNYRAVDGLANEYGFDFYFFWQPHLALDEKHLTDHEQDMKSRLDPDLVDLAEQVYDRIENSQEQYERLWYIGDVFADRREQIWIDEWGHITPEGNRLVANEMLRVLQIAD